jgi:hypothetical protein
MTESRANGINPNRAMKNKFSPSANCLRKMSAIEDNGLMRPTNISRQKMMIEGARSPTANGAMNQISLCLRTHPFLFMRWVPVIDFTAGA